jgi:hypothetical protein
MKSPFAIACVASIFVATGCGSTKTERTHYSFPFFYDGVEYHIISVVSPEDGGHNFLTRREGGQVVFSAKDEDQDGILDTVVIGDVSLVLANDIYSGGIDQARNRGKYRELPGSRIFQYSRLGYTLMVRTITPDEGELYNTFIHFDAQGYEVIGVDDDADGVLDRIKKGSADLTASQEQYGIVLEEGVRLGRIRATDSRYVVEPR